MLVFPLCVVAVLVTLFLVVFPFLGHRVGRATAARRHEAAKVAAVAAEATSGAAILALRGLLLAFSFNSAIQYAEGRREALIE
jgi:hypothetical protein